MIGGQIENWPMAMVVKINNNKVCASFHMSASFWTAEEMTEDLETHVKKPFFAYELIIFPKVLSFASALTKNRS